MLLAEAAPGTSHGELGAAAGLYPSLHADLDGWRPAWGWQDGRAVRKLEGCFPSAALAWQPSPTSRCCHCEGQPCRAGWALWRLPRWATSQTLFPGGSVLPSGWGTEAAPQPWPPCQAAGPHGPGGSSVQPPAHCGCGCQAVVCPWPVPSRPPQLGTAESCPLQAPWPSPSREHRNGLRTHIAGCPGHYPPG